MAVVSAYVDIADGNVIFFETERVIEDSLSRAVCDVSVPQLRFRFFYVPERKHGKKRIHFLIAQEGKQGARVFLRELP